MLLANVPASSLGLSKISYGNFFIFGRQNQASWSSLSKQLLDIWGLCDFCEGNIELGLKACQRHVG